MSDTDSGCENGSNDDLTPVIVLENNYENESPRHNHRESLSQLDAMMPRMQYGASQSQVCSTGLVRKRLSDIIPSSIPVKAIVRPPLSEAALREEAVRIVKTFPRGEATMWSIMHAVEYSDMKILCKFLGVKHRLSKVDMGKTILKAMQNGEFKQLTNPVAEKRSNAVSVNSEKKAVSEEKSGADLETVRSPILNVQKKPPEIVSKVSSIPVVAVGGAIDWKQVDHGLRKLLNEHELVKMQGGIYINTTDWKICSAELEAELEDKNAIWSTRQRIKLLEKHSFHGFRKIDCQNYRNKDKKLNEENYNVNVRCNERRNEKNESDRKSEVYDSDEIFVCNNESGGKGREGRESVERREKEVLYKYSTDSSCDDDNGPIFTNNSYQQYSVQNSKNSENSINGEMAFTKYCPPPKYQLNLRNRNVERPDKTKKFGMKNKSFGRKDENFDNEKEVKNVTQKSPILEENAPHQVLGKNVPQVLMKSNNQKNANFQYFDGEKKSDDFSLKFFNEEKNEITNEINSIRNKIFPELQNHLLKRFGNKKSTSSSQTENSYENDTLIPNSGGTGFRLLGPSEEKNKNNNIMENTENVVNMNKTFREVDNQNKTSFLAMKIIRFDNDKLGLIFAKRNIGTNREIAIIQSKLNSLLPDVIMNMLALGDILISINGQIVKNQLFNQQIQLIKISCRPITLGFVPDRFK